MTTPPLPATVVEHRADVDPATLPEWARMLPEVAELAKIVAGTDFVPRNLRGKPAAVAAAILAGHELGLPPLTAVNRLHVVDGRVAISAEAIRALILRAGHQLWTEDHTSTRVTIAGRRTGTDTVERVTWTLDDAKRAGLAGRPQWRTYPRAMLLARATAELGRLMFADVLAGISAVEELEDPELEPTTAPAEAETKPRRRTRKRPDKTPSPAAALTTGPTIPAEPDGPPEPELPDELPAPAEPPPVDPRDDLDDDTPPPPSPAAFTALHAAYTAAGMRGRDTRVAHAETILGRNVSSSRDLTAAEVTTLLDTLHTDTVVNPHDGEEPTA